MSKIPKLSVSQEKRNYLHEANPEQSPAKSPVKSMSKSALIGNKPAYDSYESSVVGSAYVSPYRASRIQKKEKILESFDNQEMDQKIKALNQ